MAQTLVECRIALAVNFLVALVATWKIRRAWWLVLAHVASLALSRGHSVAAFGEHRRNTLQARCATAALLVQGIGRPPCLSAVAPCVAARRGASEYVVRRSVLQVGAALGG